MFKKSLVAVAAIASATAAMTTTAQAGWGWIGYQSDSSWAVYDYSAGRWNTVYTQNYVNGLRGQINGLQTMVAEKNNRIAGLKAEVAAQQDTIDGLNEVIETMETDLGLANDQVEFLTGARDAAETALKEATMNLGIAYDELNDADAEIASLTAELAVANAALAAQPEVPGAPAVPDSEEVSALMTEVSNSGILTYVSMDNVEELIRTGVLVSGSSSTTIADIEAFGIDTEALQELRDIRVAAVEAGKAHSSYNGTVDAHSVNRTDSVVYDSFGNDDGLSTMFTINGRTVDLTETGADMVFTNGAAEITDWIDGFENGYNAGYEDGYADGFADGYAAGVSDSTN